MRLNNLQAAQSTSSATVAGGGFQNQATANSAGGDGRTGINTGTAQGQQGVPTNTSVGSTQTPGRPPALIAATTAAGSGGPVSAGGSDFIKEEIIELQEMRLSPIPSIRNRFAGSSSKVHFMYIRNKLNLCNIVR